MNHPFPSQTAISLTPDAIGHALHQPLPGLSAMMRMAPIPRPLEPLTPDHRPREGGVLLLLYPNGAAGELHLVLTRRSDTLGNHRGQISFPGGSVDPDDQSTRHTALREACEEIGVCEEDMRLLGSLTPLYIPPSNFRIHPHVAYLPRRPQFHLQPDEVAELLEPPISHFLDDRNIGIEDWPLRDNLVAVPFYNVCGHKVWGATAMVLAEFATILKDLGSAVLGIESTPGIAGGEPCIAGTRIPVWLLVQARQLGSSDADLLKTYPQLTAEDLANGWAYHRSHRAEIEQQIQHNEVA